MIAKRTQTEKYLERIATTERGITNFEFARERIKRMFRGQEDSPELKSALEKNEATLHSLRLELSHARDLLAAARKLPDAVAKGNG